MATPLRLSLVMMLAALTLLALPRASDATQVNIGMGPYYYSAANVTVQVGDTVVWTNTDSISHSVTSDNGFFDSGSTQSGITFSRTFTTPGTFPYHCIFHNGMTGVINVVPVAATPPPPPTTVPPPQQSNTGALRAQAEALLAKVQQLQAQLGAPMPPAASNQPGITIDSSSCPLIGRSLKKGSSGDDVTRLQQFLARDFTIYPEALATGYYGSLTEAAVKRWQAKYNIVSSGSPESTGYGVVGPRTAAAIAILCSTGSYNGVPGPSGAGAPVGGFIQVTPISGNAPHAINVQTTVNTTNSCAGAIYTLDYGDGTQPARIAVPAGQCTQLTQTLGHTYAYGGTYLMTLSAGAHRTTATVQVYGAGPPQTAPTPTPPSAPSSSWGIISVTPAVGGDSLAIAIEIEHPSCLAYSIDWGDGSFPSNIAAQSGCSGGSATATANHTYGLSGTYVVSLRDGGGTTKASSAVTIVN
ncbi:peptidoglycan-binding protein [Candidatus Kaiserbacteria bacterium]|nr:peptidoglycan-binding protein [Candidatus Kaiserbacteria bacterium]